MKITDVEQKLKKLMAEIFKMQESEITDSLKMKETDVWDSLKHMELITSIEEIFTIELTFDEIVQMITFSEIKRVLKGKGICS